MCVCKIKSILSDTKVVLKLHPVLSKVIRSHFRTCGSAQSEFTVASEYNTKCFQLAKVMYKHLGPTFDKHIPLRPGKWVGTLLNVRRTQGDASRWVIRKAE